MIGTFQLGQSASFLNLSASNQIRGSASDTSNAPSYTWASDTNTGMYHASNDMIGFSTGGETRMVVGSNVNILGDLNITGSLFQNGGGQQTERRYD
jgi:hypothetical protein